MCQKPHKFVLLGVVLIWFISLSWWVWCLIFTVIDPWSPFCLGGTQAKCLLRTMVRLVSSLGLTTTDMSVTMSVAHIASMKQLLLRMWMPSARPHSQLAAWPMGCSTNVAPCAKQCTTIEPLWFRRCWAQKRVLIQMEDWNGKFASTNCDHLECLADS